MTDALDQIAQEGAELEGAAGAAPGAPPPPEVDADQEAIAFWAMIPDTLGKVLTIGLPELRDVYNREACMAWGAAANVVAKKRGWNVASSPEIALIGASLVFAIPTGTAIARRVQERKAKAAAEVKARGEGAVTGGAAAESSATPPNVNAP